MRELIKQPLRFFLPYLACLLACLRTSDNTNNNNRDKCLALFAHAQSTHTPQSARTLQSQT